MDDGGFSYAWRRRWVKRGRKRFTKMRAVLVGSFSPFVQIHSLFYIRVSERFLFLFFGFFLREHGGHYEGTRIAE